mmetsp:Transcript_26903/g.66294  ORF Transcript_26903/g.66294 Transcript_26903/m.66294 type:complete len:239 (+) Transcript_26903:2803-3519(+)
MPSFPMSSARVVSLPCSGVSSRSSSSSTMICPHALLGPTAVTTKQQSPSTTVQPENRKGWLSSLCTASASPVSDDSSTLRSLPLMKMPSAGTLAPRSRMTMSPTMTSTLCTRISMPLRLTVTAQSCCLSCSTRNCFSLALSLYAVMFPIRRHAKMMAAPSSQSRHLASPSVSSPRSMGPCQMGLRGHACPRSAAHTMMPSVIDTKAAARRISTVESCIASMKRSQYDGGSRRSILLEP